MEQANIQTDIETLITWLNSFPHLSKQCKFMNPVELFDGIIILEVLNQMDGVIWPKELISYKETTFSKENFILINQGLTKFYKKYGCPPLENYQRKDLINPDVNKFTQPAEILKVLQLVVGVAVQCENKESLIYDIMQNLDEDMQTELMKIIQTVLQKYSPQVASDFGSFSNIQEVSNTSQDSATVQIVECQATIEKLETQNKQCLKSLNELEQDNASLKIQYQESIKEIEYLKSQIVQQTITKKTLNLQKTLEDLQLEHGDLEQKLDKIREYESQIEMKNRTIFEHEKNYDRLKKQFAQEKSQVQEELDIEKEKILQLQKVEMQIQVYRKKAEDYNQVLLISEQKDQKIRQLEDTINQLDQDLSGKRQLEEQLKFVREEQNKEKLRVSQYEIQLQNREHQVNDLTKELKLQKKKEEMNLEKIRQLEEDLEERGRDSLSSINDGRDNLQSSLIQDLENRVKSLTQENEILKISNSAQLNQKLFEIEQSLIEEQRQKQSLLSQLELQIQRCQKFEDENESLRLNMETQKFEAKSDMKSPKQNDQKSNDDKKKLEENLNQAQARIKELEQNSSQILILQQQREQTLVEIKALYTEKNQMIDQIMKLKDELNSTKSQVQELQMKERFFDKEKQLLESQLKNQPSLQRQVAIGMWRVFKPEDYSRFLIREFLKKNGFDKTYDQFMAEDTRPKVTMTKNELMKLIGIEGLMRRNSKTKQFETMLDILCDFLIITRAATGGVQLPEGTNNSNSNNSVINQSIVSKASSTTNVNDTSTVSTNVSQSKAEGSNGGRKAGSQIRQKPAPQQQQQPAKTASNWFGSGNNALEDEQPRTQIKQNSNQKNRQNNIQEVDDDWDLEEDSKANNNDDYLPVHKTRIQDQHQDPWAKQQQVNQQRPGTSYKATRQIPAPTVANKRRGVAQPKEHDIDELDDLMGFGGGQNQDELSRGLGKNAGQEQMRDTLGFLKKSEQEKKMKEEQKKLNQIDLNQKHKVISELKHSLSGFEEEESGNFDYNLAQLSASQRQQIRQYYNEGSISQSESTEIRRLLFKNPSSNFHDSWHQGFYFDKKLNYGIYQKDGGPCGILASVQALFLKHVLFVSETPLQNLRPERRDNYIAAAIVDILINASDDKQNTINLVIPAQSQNPKNPILPHQCQKLVINTSDKNILYNIVKDNISYFVNAEGHGVILLVYSVIMTKGIQNIINDMDMKDNCLLTEHGYASQELINIILVGKAASNVFNGDKDMGDNFILKGIHKQSEIGFLTLYEAYGYFQVGTYYKNPKVPIWLICSESHYSVIFSTDFSMTTSKRQQVFDLVYYDELSRQEDDYIMTVKLGAYTGPLNLQETTEMVPPIDAVIRTKWDRGLVNWNGRQPIL